MVKKKYVKPQILIDSFEMSESIAAGCLFISNSAEYVCAVEDKEAEMTYISPSTCEFSSPNLDDMICYHAPSDYNNVFSS